ncbi:peptide deformylase [bacterium endosymbiont of Pedicinus badii]|uniref:peptide deformylase n=1 Tax=bacterium endosymbiont of Pedicinus badii TaxID=1719126 RepID=UPI0009BC044E|nr:peptide deformylase [bacterium endosymbiont of Pedicinus badii]OQM34127.1 peptide deformylase [bacterium endosymbiont of Pedicinus badii]
MTILKILQYPNKNLRKEAKKVIKVDRYIKKIIQDMFETMYYTKGIGLAATQVNIHKRIIVIDITKSRNQKLVFINPKLLKYSGSIKMQEGCLSIPNKFAYVKRYKNIKISALDENSRYFEIKAKDLLSVCIQHEIDHLFGKLFIDRISENL